MNNFYNALFKIAKCTLILLAVLNTAGWVSGENPVDSTEPDGGIISCITYVSRPFDEYYSKSTSIADECHRWGLVWEGILGTTSYQINRHIFRELSSETWASVLELADPNNDGATRLPTIKELVRIFDYTVIPVEVAAGKGLAVPALDYHFRSYLQADIWDPEVLTGYLISSTYRNINAGERTPKVLGIEIQTGKVVAFNQDLTWCEELSTGGGCETSTDVNVYAFRVRELP